MATLTTEKLINQFEKFLEQHPPRRVSRHLRWMLMDCLDIHLRDGFPLYFDEVVWDLRGLFYLLDAAEDEQRKAKKQLKKASNGISGQEDQPQ
jgi:hypothetical protein